MLILLALLACGDPERAFARDVVPAFERGCASSQCHGVGPGAEARGEVLADGVFAFPVDDRGRVTDVAAARLAALAKITTVEDPEHSTLLRKPLDPAYGGFAHLGGASWASPEHPDYQLVKAWIALEAAGGEDAPELDPHEQAFADDVQAPLVAMGCLGGGCHSPASGVPFRLDTGIDGEIGRAGTRANLAAARTMLSLDGDPLQSRLLRKMLPLHDGGIAHKGGNRSFLTGVGDDRLPAMVAWIEEERRLRLGDAPAGVTGIVFVRGPLAAEDPFDLDVYAPGTDLWLADLSASGLVTGERSLTEALHDGPSDVRDPAVDDAGARVAFAMRTSPDAGHTIWVLDLSTGAAEQVTSGPGTDRDPTWGPDGALWFVSTRAGVVADGGDRLDSDLYRLDPGTGEITRRSWTPHVEREPIFFVHGDEAGGEIGFTALRETVPSQRRAHPFRFPPGLETEYHQHFGITPPEDLFFDMRELPDGRYVTVVGDLTGVWGGRLGVVDRNFGPELQSGAPGIPVYLAPLARLDPESASSGVTGSLYRDPVALPDGALLAAWAPGPLDLADPDADPPDLRIVRIRLHEAEATTIADRDVIIDAPGLADRDPEPVYAREPAPLTEAAWSPEDTTALLRHQGVATTDALLGALQPGGRKPLLDNVVAVRIVEAIPVGTDVRRPVPAAETLHGVEGATTTSLSPHGPARVVAEIPVEEDGSFQVVLQPETAVRLQLLDADGMRVGANHNRWFDLAPGQTLNQGVPTAVYRSTCAVCHGALDGDPTEVYPEPDIVTSASLTLARYVDQDPRLPRAPIVPGPPIAADFSATVRPILDLRCAGCHDAASPAAGLSLSAEPTVWFDVAYEELSHGWIDGAEGSARASPLIEVLRGGHGGATDAEIRAVARWIEAGASWSVP